MTQPERMDIFVGARYARPFGLRHAFTALLIGTFACGSIGCGKKDEAAKDSESAKQAAQSATADQRRKRHGNLRDNLEKENFDLNEDGEPDQFHYRDGERLIRVERDMNFDGKTDLWQYTDDSGNIVEEEMDLDLDGKVDLVAYYKDGVISRKEMSVNFDDKFTIVKLYNKKGNLLRVERDQDGDGLTDIWEFYGENGQRNQVAWDENNDGEWDTVDKLD
ncbi:MAG: hypothetical protein ACQEVA_14970 [Myxococcota bacterium]